MEFTSTAVVDLFVFMLKRLFFTKRLNQLYKLIPHYILMKSAWYFINDKLHVDPHAISFW